MGMKKVSGPGQNTQTNNPEYFLYDPTHARIMYIFPTQRPVFVVRVSASVCPSIISFGHTGPPIELFYS
ncbi:hypothetical protein KDW_49530 [Dictyobacter vulcani]|uniref:Uncharacterized protein n=1 Tax=Dictyobacter vulcani TaxID=2607529 RepID=A0A5J4KWD9_9CHLR|nr:hypothetical protein KDW_49530 [Dictyobacter vulcani]